MEQSKVKFIHNDASFMEQVHKIKERRQKEINKRLVISYLILWVILVAVYHIFRPLSTTVMAVGLVVAHIAFILDIRHLSFKFGEYYIHTLLDTDEQRYAVYINLESLYERDKNLIIDISDGRFVARSFKTGSWYFKEITVNDNKEHKDYLEIDWKNMECSS